MTEENSVSKRLFTLAMKTDRVMEMSNLCQQKFAIAANRDDKEAMDTARNEYHAVMDEILDLSYENARLRSEMEADMLKKLK